MADYLQLAIEIHLPLAGKVGEVALVAATAVLLAFGLRYACLLWKARTPRVQLSSLVTATREEEEAEKKVDPLWVGSLLREQLTALKLSATEAIPDASQGPPLLEIVEGIGEGIGDKSQLGKAVGRLFRAIVPEAAYEVSGTVRPTEGSSGTISVQVVDRTHRHRTWVGTGEGSTWSEAARKAATGVAGALYPQVANRHKGPWASWRKPVPAELVALNYEARRHEEGNRLEQAMGTYQAALELDPLNPALRLRIAILQERLELYLGAWATYRAIADETHRDSWKGGNRRIRLLALYRMAILLGNRKVADRCIEDAPDPGEEDFKPELREALRAERPLVRTSWWNRFPFLAEAFPIGFVHTPAIRLLDRELERSDPTGQGRPARRAAAGGRRGVLLNKQLGLKKGESKTAARERIRRLLEIVSLIHLEQLDVRLRRKPPRRPSGWGDWWRYRPGPRRALSHRELSLSAVRVSKLIARLRIVGSVDPSSKKVAHARKRLQGRWPFPRSTWQIPARWLRPRHRVADRREDAWQYHYNAACAISRALPLNPETRDDESKEKRIKLVDSGIDQLEEYVHRAGGDQVRAQIVWVAREDADLAELRATKDYKRWKNHHLPPLSDEQDRAALVDPPRVAVRIAHHGARTFAKRWHARAGRRPVAPEALTKLWTQEAEAWKALAKLFKEHRSWEERWKGIATLQTCLRIDGEGEINATRSVRDPEGSHDMTPLLCWLEGNGDGERAEVPLVEKVGSWALANAERAKAGAAPGAAAHPIHRLQRQESARAARIWGRLGDALEEELVVGDEKKAPLDNTVDCLVEIRSEVSTQSA